MKNLRYAIVFVSDMKQSVAFYRETLGIPLKFESPEWTEFVTDGATLALHVADSMEPEGTERGENPAGSCLPGFQVEDIAAFHQRMTQAGVRCLQAPHDPGFGVKLAKYADPDGLPISVSQVMKQQ